MVLGYKSIAHYCVSLYYVGTLTIYSASGKWNLTIFSFTDLTFHLCEILRQNMLPDPIQSGSTSVKEGSWRVKRV